MPKVAIDLSGASFYHWKVLSYSHTIQKERYYHCQCICGNKKVVSIRSLKRGKSKSCCHFGAINNRKTHGEANKSREYAIWRAMKYRCLIPTCKEYRYYGGRGILICDRWINSFENFLKDMGRRPTPNHSIDRYPDKNGNYEPSNCRWATSKEQANNTRRNVFLEYAGISMTIGNWTKLIGLSGDTLRNWFNKGKTLEHYVKRKKISPQQIIDYFNNISAVM